MSEVLDLCEPSQDAGPRWRSHIRCASSASCNPATEVFRAAIRQMYLGGTVQAPQLHRQGVNSTRLQKSSASSLASLGDQVTRTRTFAPSSRSCRGKSKQRAPERGQKSSSSAFLAKQHPTYYTDLADDTDPSLGSRDSASPDQSPEYKATAARRTVVYLIKRPQTLPRYGRITPAACHADRVLFSCGNDSAALRPESQSTGNSFLPSGRAAEKCGQRTEAALPSSGNSAAILYSSVQREINQTWHSDWTSGRQDCTRSCKASETGKRISPPWSVDNDSGCDCLEPEDYGHAGRLQAVHRASKPNEIIDCSSIRRCAPGRAPDQGRRPPANRTGCPDPVYSVPGSDQASKIGFSAVSTLLGQSLEPVDTVFSKTNDVKGKCDGFLKEVRLQSAQKLDKGIPVSSDGSTTGILILPCDIGTTSGSTGRTSGHQYFRHSPFNGGINGEHSSISQGVHGQTTRKGFDHNRDSILITKFSVPSPVLGLENQRLDLSTSFPLKTLQRDAKLKSGYFTAGLVDRKSCAKTELSPERSDNWNHFNNFPELPAGRCNFHVSTQVSSLPDTPYTVESSHQCSNYVPLHGHADKEVSSNGAPIEISLTETVDSPEWTTNTGHISSDLAIYRTSDNTEVEPQINNSLAEQASLEVRSETAQSAIMSTPRSHPGQPGTTAERQAVAGQRNSEEVLSSSPENINGNMTHHEVITIKDDSDLPEELVSSFTGRSLLNERVVTWDDHVIKIPLSSQQSGEPTSPDILHAGPQGEHADHMEIFSDAPRIAQAQKSAERLAENTNREEPELVCIREYVFKTRKQDPADARAPSTSGASPKIKHLSSRDVLGPPASAKPFSNKAMTLTEEDIDSRFSPPEKDSRPNEEAADAGMQMTHLCEGPAASETSLSTDEQEQSSSTEASKPKEPGQSSNTADDFQQQHQEPPQIEESREKLNKCLETARPEVPIKFARPEKFEKIIDSNEKTGKTKLPQPSASDAATKQHGEVDSMRMSESTPNDPASVHENSLSSTTSSSPEVDQATEDLGSSRNPPKLKDETTTSDTDKFIKGNADRSPNLLSSYRDSLAEEEEYHKPWNSDFSCLEDDIRCRMTSDFPSVQKGKGHEAEIVCKDSVTVETAFSLSRDLPQAAEQPEATSPESEGAQPTFREKHPTLNSEETSLQHSSKLKEKLRNAFSHSSDNRKLPMITLQEEASSEVSNIEGQDDTEDNKSEKNKAVATAEQNKIPSPVEKDRNKDRNGCRNQDQREKDAISGNETPEKAPEMQSGRFLTIPHYGHEVKLPLSPKEARKLIKAEKKNAMKVQQSREGTRAEDPKVTSSRGSNKALNWFKKKLAPKGKKTSRTKKYDINVTGDIEEEAEIAVDPGSKSTKASHANSASDDSFSSISSCSSTSGSDEELPEKKKPKKKGMWVGGKKDHQKESDSDTSTEESRSKLFSWSLGRKKESGLSDYEDNLPASFRKDADNEQCTGMVGTFKKISDTMPVITHKQSLETSKNKMQNSGKSDPKVPASLKSPLASDKLTSNGDSEEHDSGYEKPQTRAPVRKPARKSPKRMTNTGYELARPLFLEDPGNVAADKEKSTKISSFILSGESLFEERAIDVQSKVEVQGILLAKQNIVPMQGTDPAQKSKELPKEGAAGDVSEKKQMKSSQAEIALTSRKQEPSLQEKLPLSAQVVSENDDSPGHVHLAKVSLDLHDSENNTTPQKAERSNVSHAGQKDSSSIQISAELPIKADKPNAKVGGPDLDLLKSSEHLDDADVSDATATSVADGSEGPGKEKSKFVSVDINTKTSDPVAKTSSKAASISADSSAKPSVRPKLFTKPKGFNLRQTEDDCSRIESISYTPKETVTALANANVRTELKFTTTSKGKVLQPHQEDSQDIKPTPGCKPVPPSKPPNILKTGTVTVSRLKPQEDEKTKEESPSLRSDMSEDSRRSSSLLSDPLTSSWGEENPEPDCSPIVAEFSLSLYPHKELIGRTDPQGHKTSGIEKPNGERSGETESDSDDKSTSGQGKVDTGSDVKDEMRVSSDEDSELTDVTPLPMFPEGYRSTPVAVHVTPDSSSTLLSSSDAAVTSSELCDMSVTPVSSITESTLTGIDSSNTLADETNEQETDESAYEIVFISNNNEPTSLLQNLAEVPPLRPEKVRKRHKDLPVTILIDNGDDPEENYDVPPARPAFTFPRESSLPVASIVDKRNSILSWRSISSWELEPEDSILPYATYHKPPQTSDDNPRQDDIEENSTESDENPYLNDGGENVQNSMQNSMQNEPSLTAEEPEEAIHSSLKEMFPHLFSDYQPVGERDSLSSSPDTKDTEEAKTNEIGQRNQTDQDEGKTTTNSESFQLESSNSLSDDGSTSSSSSDSEIRESRKQREEEQEERSTREGDKRNNERDSEHIDHFVQNSELARSVEAIDNLYAALQREEEEMEKQSLKRKKKKQSLENANFNKLPGGQLLSFKDQRTELLKSPNISHTVEQPLSKDNSIVNTSPSLIKEGNAASNDITMKKAEFQKDKVDDNMDKVDDKKDKMDDKKDKVDNKKDKVDDKRDKVDDKKDTVDDKKDKVDDKKDKVDDKKDVLPPKGGSLSPAAKFARLLENVMGKGKQQPTKIKSEDSRTDKIKSEDSRTEKEKNDIKMADRGSDFATFKPDTPQTLLEVKSVSNTEYAQVKKTTEPGTAKAAKATAQDNISESPESTTFGKNHKLFLASTYSAWPDNTTSSEDVEYSSPHAEKTNNKQQTPLSVNPEPKIADDTRADVIKRRPPPPIRGVSLAASKLPAKRSDVENSEILSETHEATSEGDETTPEDSSAPKHLPRISLRRGFVEVPESMARAGTKPDSTPKPNESDDSANNPLSEASKESQTPAEPSAGDAVNNETALLAVNLSSAESPPEAPIRSVSLLGGATSHDKQGESISDAKGENREERHRDETVDDCDGKSEDGTDEEDSDNGGIDAEGPGDSSYPPLPDRKYRRKQTKYNEYSNVIRVDSQKLRDARNRSHSKPNLFDMSGGKKAVKLRNSLSMDDLVSPHKKKWKPPKPRKTKDATKDEERKGKKTFSLKPIQDFFRPKKKNKGEKVVDVKKEKEEEEEKETDNLYEVVDDFPEPPKTKKEGASGKITSPKQAKKQKADQGQGSQHAPLVKVDSSHSDSDIRPIGRLLQLNADGTQLLELVRPPNGHLGVQLTLGNEQTSTGKFVSGFVDKGTEKLLSGILNVGDQILKINDCPVDSCPLNEVHNIIDTRQRLKFLVYPAASH